jgi:hypothetical protein
MSASLSRHATQALTSSSGDGILFPVVVASTVAVAAGVSMVIRPKRNDASTESSEDNLDSPTSTVDAVDQDSSDAVQMSQGMQIKKYDVLLFDLNYSQ